MKGVIFNVVEDAVVRGRGEAVWDVILDRSELDGSWTALGDYPDAHLLALVETAAAVLETDPDTLIGHLGHDALLELSGRYPAFFAPHQATIPFLLTLNDVIHPEVRKLHPSAQPPWFGFAQQGPHELLVEYHSHRPLCRLAGGMIRGAATTFGETATVTHEACARDGAAYCRLRCVVLPAGAVPAAAAAPPREMAAT